MTQLQPWRSRDDAWVRSLPRELEVTVQPESDFTGPWNWIIRVSYHRFQLAQQTLPSTGPAATSAGEAKLAALLAASEFYEPQLKTRIVRVAQQEAAPPEETCGACIIGPQHGLPSVDPDDVSRPDVEPRPVDLAL